MEILTGILLFLLGLIAGIGIMLLRGKWDSGVQQTQTALNQCQQDQAQLKQDWQDQLAQFRSVATNLDEMSRHINSNIQEAESLLNKAPKTPSFPFFSKEATEILQSADSKKREKTMLSDQPLDYSSTKSGVFEGENSNKKQSV